MRVRIIYQKVYALVDVIGFFIYSYVGDIRFSVRKHDQMAAFQS
jgi:hypothetical protein